MLLDLWMTANNVRCTYSFWESGCYVDAKLIAAPFTPSTNNIDISFKYTYNDYDTDDFLKVVLYDETNSQEINTLLYQTSQLFLLILQRTLI